MVTKFFFFLSVLLYANVTQAAKVCNGMDIPTYDSRPAAFVSHVYKNGFSWHYSYKEEPSEDETIEKHIPKDEFLSLYITTHHYEYPSKEKALPVAVGDSVFFGYRKYAKKMVFGFIVLCGKGNSKITKFTEQKIP